MTAICGIGEGPGRRAWLATDGQNTVGHQPVPDGSKRPRIKTLNDGRYFGVVVAGYAFMATVLDLWVPPEVVDDDPHLALAGLGYSLGEFCMGDETIWRRVVDSEDMGGNGCNLVVALDGVIATIDSRFHVVIPEHGIAFGGCSGDVALSAALALHRHEGWDIPSALLEGLGITGELDGHTGPTYTVVGLSARSHDLFLATAERP